MKRLAISVPNSVYLQICIIIFLNKFLKTNLVFHIFQSIKNKRRIPKPREELGVGVPAPLSYQGLEKCHSGSGVSQ